MAEKKKPTERKGYEVKVTTHRHMGKPCKVGAKIKLTAAQAERLKKKRVI